MPKLIRVTTVPLALQQLLRGQMKYMKEAGFDVIMVSGNGKEWQDVIDFENCPYRIISMTRKITPFQDLKSLWRLYTLFKREKPDIVHSHTPKAGLLSMLAARMAGVKIRIHTVAGLRFMTSVGLTRRILIAMEKLTGNAATQIWPNSLSLKKYMEENKLAAARKIEVIGKGSSNGIDLTRFSKEKLCATGIEKAKELIGYKQGLIYLLSVGRIVKDKGIAELVKAFATLYKQNDKLRLILVGNFEEKLDPLDEECMQTIQSHPGIIFTGWHNDVEYFMNIAHILVHPSHREGFPNVLLQAGAMECPIVCSGIEGNIDIVEENVSGLIFTVKDERDLAEKLATAIAEPQKMKIMSQLLRKKIEQDFDRKYVQAMLKEKYEHLIKTKS